jgi:hypothetical protein
MPHEPNDDALPAIFATRWFWAYWKRDCARSRLPRC